MAVRPLMPAGRQVAEECHQINGTSHLPLSFRHELACMTVVFMPGQQEDVTSYNQ